jgi:hypothetical protein
MTSPLCFFSDWFPAHVAYELEAAKRVRHQSRETSWTDRMLLELKKLQDPRIIVQSSNERVTSADMDWIFTNFDRRRHLWLTLQAKILHYTREHAPDRDDELAHKGPISGARRAGAEADPPRAGAVKGRSGYLSAIPLL